MWRLIKVLLVLAVLAAIALVIYSYVGEYFDPALREPLLRPITQDVDLGLD
jgi:hypothetical protein